MKLILNWSFMGKNMDGVIDLEKAPRHFAQSFLKMELSLFLSLQEKKKLINQILKIFQSILKIYLTIHHNYMMVGGFGLEF